MALLYTYVPQINLATDTIIQVGNTPYNPGVSAAELVQQQPDVYSFQTNSDGENKLCVIKDDSAALWFTILDANNNPYTVKATDFVYCDYVGGHPIHRPGQL